MKKLLHVKIEVKKTKLGVVFDYGSQFDLIVEYMVSKLELELHGDPRACPLGWVNKDVKMRVTNKCKVNFSISSNYIDEVEVDIVPLDVCGVAF